MLQAQWAEVFIAVKYSGIYHPLFCQRRSQTGQAFRRQRHLPDGRDDGANKAEYAIVQVPTGVMSRFVELPLHLNKSKKKGRYRRQIILLDDIIVHCLKDLFNGFFDFCEIQAFSLKLTRDAEYNISDTLDQSLIDKMSKGIKQRLKSEPVRMVYDSHMPEHMLKMLKKLLGYSSYDSLIPGGKYRNFKDFIGFPNIGHPSLEFPAYAGIKKPGI